MNTSKNEGLSIIVPFLNEEEGIELFCTTLDEYALNLSFPIELVFVDDGSKDRSVEILSSYSFKNIGKAQLVQFSRNFGSHAAIRAGLQYASYPGWEVIFRSLLNFWRNLLILSKRDMMRSMYAKNPSPYRK